MHTYTTPWGSELALNHDLSTLHDQLALEGYVIGVHTKYSVALRQVIQRVGHLKANAAMRTYAFMVHWQASL